MSRTDDITNNSNHQFSDQEHEIVLALKTYLKTIDTIDPHLLAERPCVDLRLTTYGEMMTNDIVRDERL